MNANKPAPPAGSAFASVFTKRVADHLRVAYYLHPACAAPVFFVIDELLVAHDAVPTVIAALNTPLHPHLVVDTGKTVFGESPVQPSNDVHILRLTSTPGNQAFADVAMAVWTARTAVSNAGGNPAHVSPNHVLVAAPNFHSCPHGPPWAPVKDPLELGAPAGTVRVAVIDSGYETGGAIDDRASHRYGSWFTAKTDAPTGYVWVDESTVPTGVDPLDQDGDHRLDALVGHANFVAGVIAQACPMAQIEVVSHNGAFVYSDDADTPIPTEASVALSLWEVLHEGGRQPNVINVGFAFPTLPAEIPGPAVADGLPSYTFSVALDAIDDRPATVVVAPAGNQNCTVPQYPAAFAGSYPNVIGVGSLNGDGRSDFSNHGPWVKCCTEGEAVVSTFVTAAQVVPEESESGAAIDFDGWASWSGTSFAAPKVAGAIARIVETDDVNALSAWKRLIDLQPSPTSLEMGVALRGLAP